MLCHPPFLFPLAGLMLFALLPLPVALALYLPLTALSLAIGILTVRAMYRPAVTGSEGMRGKKAVVVTAERQSGMLRCDSELWKYKAPQPLAPGDQVEIVELDGLTAVVRPAHRSQTRRETILALFLLTLASEAWAEPERLYVTNLGGNTLSVIDGRTLTVTKTIPTARDPHFAVPTPEGTRLYVTMAGADEVWVFETATDRVAAKIPLGLRPTHLAMAPDGRFVYASLETSQEVGVISTATNRVEAKIPTGPEPHITSVSRDGKAVYVGGAESHQIFVIDPAARWLVDRIRVGFLPHLAVFSPDGRRAWASSTGSNELSVIETATRTVDGRTLYVASEVGHMVLVVDTASARVLARIPVGRMPHTMVLSRDGAFAYTADKIGRAH